MLNYIKILINNIQISNKQLRQYALVCFVIALISTVINHQESYFEEFIYELISVFFFALIIFVNVKYLFPLYLQKNNFGTHLLYLAIASAIITPIRTYILFQVTSDIAGKHFVLNNQFTTFFSTFLIGSGSSIYCAMMDWLKGQNQKQELRNETLQSELKFLKSQINPHFLFNTLNSLYALTLKKSDLAPEIVLRLSEMMRYMLYECNEKQVPLEKEVNYLMNYLELEKLRHGTKLDVDLKVAGSIKFQKIAPLMFIPFVENSFKHGVSHHITKGFVNINISADDQLLDLTIENSKTPTMPSTSLKKSGGIGLANIKRRLELLYPEQYQLNISEQPNTYSVNLKINLNQ